MWIDDHPYLSIYLAGCVASLITSLLNIIFLFVYKWITKGNIVAKNLKKISPPDNQTFVVKAGIFILGFLYITAISWIGVLTNLWQVISLIFKTIRELLTSVPEEIKELRFPVTNNPNLSREAAWAYFYALSVKVGQTLPDVSGVLSSLEELEGYYPSFKPKTAIRFLADLNVLKEEMLRAITDQMNLERELENI